jgi:hypothetical protein
MHARAILWRRRYVAVGLQCRVILSKSIGDDFVCARNVLSCAIDSSIAMPRRILLPYAGNQNFMCFTIALSCGILGGIRLPYRTILPVSEFKFAMHDAWILLSNAFNVASTMSGRKFLRGS